LNKRRAVTKIFFCSIFLLFLFQTSLSYGQFKKDPSTISRNSQEIRDLIGINSEYGNIPLHFIPNKGQVSPEALFYAKTPGYTLWITEEGFVFDQIGINNKHDVSRFHFLGASKNCEVIPINYSDYKVNYIQGRNPSQWLSNIVTSTAVLYKKIYNNIDLKVYGKEKQVEYDFIVKPEGEVGDIRFTFPDAPRTRIDRRGNLLIRTRLGKIKHFRPVGYQIIEGQHIKVDTEFKRIKKNTYGFNTGKFNPNYNVIIDPMTLVYSTYLGGSSTEEGYGIALDSSGNAYVTGYTKSTDFPTTLNPVDTADSEEDVFVTKFNASGNALVYSTYISGSKQDWGKGIAVDTSGNAYVTGFTKSTNFPTTPNPIDGDLGYTSAYDADAFVLKLNSTGSTLLYSTYLGGSKYDQGDAIALGSDNSVYITGYTNSTNFPPVNAYDSVYGGDWYDAFVTKINAAGDAIVYSTYLGGGKLDMGHGIAVNSSGNAYIVGRTESTNFPPKNAYQSTHQGYTPDDGDDAFVTKLSSSGSTLEYSTYLGGSNDDYGYSIDVDSSGNAYVTGRTSSTNFPTSNHYQGNKSGPDAFVTKFTSSGALSYSTYLGGGSSDSGRSIQVDSTGQAFVTGYTMSTDFPVLNAVQNNSAGGVYDTFVTKFSSAGNALVYSTYLGGSGEDEGHGIAVDSDGKTFVIGLTSSSNFPTQNYYQNTRSGSKDAFISKINYEPPKTITVTSPNGGEAWKKGAANNISWTYSGFTGDVTIDLHKGGVFPSNITTVSVDPSLYSWNIPSDQTLGSDYKVRIYQNSTEDYSNGDFSIIYNADALTSVTIEVIDSLLSPNPENIESSATTYRYYLIKDQGGAAIEQASAELILDEVYHSYFPSNVYSCEILGNGLLKLGIDFSKNTAALGHGSNLNYHPLGSSRLLHQKLFSICQSKRWCGVRHRI